MLEVFQEWQINDKVVSTATDNAANMIKMSMQSYVSDSIYLERNNSMNDTDPLLF